MNAEICIDNQKHLERFKSSPPHQSYIAGFIDGDGTIFIRKIKQGYQSGISISQCRTNILQVIQYHFGGSITTTNSRNNCTDIIDESGYFYKSNRRNQFNLLIRSNEYMLLMNYISQSLIHKKHKIDCLCEFFKLTDIPNKDTEKQIVYEKCKSYIPLNYNFHCINIEYIAGLFDAEGCVYINKTCKSSCISLVQKNNIPLIHHIRSYLSYGKVRNHTYYISSRADCLKFISSIHQHTIVKYNQLVAMQTYLTTDNKIIKEQMYRICNKEKHQTEIFDNLNQTLDNKDGYNFTMHIRHLKHLVCREINRRRVYQEKSENMKGENNHNFGKTFSEETRKKMSTSIRNAKNGVSDDTIVKVRQLIRQGLSNKTIEEQLGLARFVVSDIKNNKLVCRNEDKPARVNKSQYELNVSRRKLQPNEILMIIDNVINNEKPASILRKLIEQRYIKNIPNNLSIDMIKNTKRDIMNNNVPFYVEDFGNDVYMKYKDLINKFYTCNITNQGRS